MEVAWEKTTVKDGLVSYTFLTGLVYGFRKKAVQVKKRVRNGDGGPTIMTLAVITGTFRIDVLAVYLASTR